MLTSAQLQALAKKKVTAAAAASHHAWDTSNREQAGGRTNDRGSSPPASSLAPRHTTHNYRTICPLTNRSGSNKTGRFNGSVKKPAG